MAGLALRDMRQYVFLDECGVTTDLLRRYGRSLRLGQLRGFIADLTAMKTELEAKR